MQRAAGGEPICLTQRADHQPLARNRIDGPQCLACYPKPVILVEGAAEERRAIRRRESVSGSQGTVTARGPIYRARVPTRNRARNGGGYFRYRT